MFADATERHVLSVEEETLVRIELECSDAKVISYASRILLLSSVMRVIAR